MFCTNGKLVSNVSRVTVACIFSLSSVSFDVILDFGYQLSTDLKLCVFFVAFSVSCGLLYELTTLLMCVVIEFHGSCILNRYISVLYCHTW